MNVQQESSYYVYDGRSMTFILHSLQVSPCIKLILCRSPIKGQNSTTDNEVEIFEDGGVWSITVSDRKQKEMNQHTSTDTVMQLLINTIMNGWPEDRHLCREELKLFWNYRGSVLF